MVSLFTIFELPIIYTVFAPHNFAHALLSISLGITVEREIENNAYAIFFFFLGGGGVKQCVLWAIRK